MNKLVAWVSRHEPTQAQRQALEGAGYTIVVVPEPVGRYSNPVQAWDAAIVACEGRLPVAIVAVLPPLWVAKLARKGRYQGVMVLRPNMQHDDVGREWWGGSFLRVTGVQLETETWYPREAAG